MRSLELTYQSLSRELKNIKTENDILNISLAVAIECIMLTKEFDSLPEIHQQYKELEKQINDEIYQNHLTIGAKAI